MSSPNDIKKGIVIKLNGELWLVIDFQRVSPGKGSSFVRTRVKNLKTGKVSDETFKSSETLDFENVQNKKMSFLFPDGDMYTFMDSISYEQVAVSKDDIGNDVKFLKEGLEVIVVMHGETPLTIQLPQKIQYTISYAEPAVKGDTASGNVMKAATLDNDLEIKVPAFINQGDEVSVNTETGEYVERVSK